MAWFRVDDRFESHPKVKRIPRAERLAAVGLWTLAGAWSSGQDTGGHVPNHMVDELCGTHEIAAALVLVGLWIELEDGYQFHDWDSVYEQFATEEQRAKWRARKQRQRAKTPANKEQTVPGQREPETGDVVDLRGHADVTRDTGDMSRMSGSLPIHSLPNQEKKKDLSGASAERPQPPAPDRFETEFWPAAPRKESKPAARKAWNRLIKNGADPDTVIAGIRRYASDPNRDPAYTKLPATWLNNECWNDPPLPKPRSPVDLYAQADAMIRNHAALEGTS